MLQGTWHIISRTTVLCTKNRNTESVVLKTVFQDDLPKSPNRLHMNRVVLKNGYVYRGPEKTLKYYSKHVSNQSLENLSYNSDTSTFFLKVSLKVKRFHTKRKVWYLSEQFWHILEFPIPYLKSMSLRKLNLLINWFHVINLLHKRYQGKNYVLY